MANFNHSKSSSNVSANSLHTLIAFVALFSVLTSCASTPEIADLVLVGGEVITLDNDQPTGQAIAIRNGRVLRVGSVEAIEALVGANTERIDLDGGLVIPGFIEGHGHFLGIGDMQLQLDFMRATNYASVIAMVEEAVADSQPGELIRGRGWHQSKWSDVAEGSVQGMPHHKQLSAISPNNPVILEHASGHAALANERAMQLAGIDRNTPDPPGGEILRDADGEPIGVFRENAIDLLNPVFSDAAAPDPRQLAMLARDECLSKGITSFHDAGSPLAVADVYHELAKAGELGLRLFVLLSDSNETLSASLDDHPLLAIENDHLAVGGIKRSIDGALGSHGAWLLEPYSDHAASHGLNSITVESLRETARIAVEYDLQLCVHAIGDRANRETLDIFQDTFEEHADRTDWRWRIEHAQHLNPDDIPRFKELGVIASMQAVHCTSDASFVVDRLGEERARDGAYVWRTLVDLGVVVTNGTDAPVENVDPIANYYSAVTRQTKAGTTFFADQRLTRIEALRSYTLNNAIASFQEDQKGSLAPGKLADITVLSRNITTIPVEEIAQTKVLYTIVGGRVLYSSN
ncbi:MAG: putative amidohydrolase YtcJ [Planctomycetota bacterium]|jgi:predicted amidohydrolase YtcJ